MFHIQNTSIFTTEILGASFEFIISKDLDVEPYVLDSFATEMILRLDKQDILFRSVDFIENEYGDVFYDYEIHYQTSSEVDFYNETKYRLKTSEVTIISIYGRNLITQEFGEKGKAYIELNNIVYTDDLFIFHCRNGEKLMLIFEPFMKGLSLYIGEEGINFFWHNNMQYKNHYKKHYEFVLPSTPPS